MRLTAAAIVTFDHVVAIIGIAVGLATLAAGIIAATFAARSWAEGKKTNATLGQQRIGDVRPRPVIASVGQTWIEAFEYWVANVGGAVARGYIAALRDGDAYGASFQIGAHQPAQRVVLNKLNGLRWSQPGQQSLQLAAVVAQDVDGHWWACLGERPLDALVPVLPSEGEPDHDWWRGVMGIPQPPQPPN